jgi:vacuolar-type H+-ATPase subunit H
VEKLERVLVVEEDARQTVGEASDQAAKIRAAAAEEARTLEADSAKASAKAVAAQRDKLLAAARTEAERLTEEAEAARAAAGEVARKRLDPVVASLASRFEG